MRNLTYYVTIISILSVLACNSILPGEVEENEVLDGTIEGLSLEEQIHFGEGDEAFAEIFTSEMGLGPIFVETSCISCHVGDGRGHPFSELVRFSHIDAQGNVDHLESLGGPQLQHRSILGYDAESIPNEANGQTSLLGPPVTGLGFLEAVADEDIIALADPDDLDGDGISGRVSYVFPPDYYEPFAHNISNNEGKYIGRFGRKAKAVNLLTQSVEAYQQDMGITSEFQPAEPEGSNIAPHEPDISTDELQAVVFYLQTLKVPPRRNENDPAVLRGEAIFTNINCSGCHTPELTTTDFITEGLSNKTFHPYTDLLLHDMGPELDDNYTEGSATTAEWRTTPLWGLGLATDAQGGNLFLMHDGRARSIEEAIEMHGGEASNSRDAYSALSAGEQVDLIAFLNSL